MGKTGHLRFGDGADGEADAFLQRYHEDMLLFQIVADRLGLGDRDGDEEAGNVGDEFHAFLSRFLHEDRRSVLNEAEILGALCIERFDLFIACADADHRILRCTVAVRPGRTAGVLVDVAKRMEMPIYAANKN